MRRRRLARCAGQREDVCRYLPGACAGPGTRLDERRRRVCGAGPAAGAGAGIGINGGPKLKRLTREGGVNGSAPPPVRRCSSWAILRPPPIFLPATAPRTTTRLPAMKLVDKIAQRAPGKLYYTLEFFPPKTDEVKMPPTT